MAETKLLLTLNAYASRLQLHLDGLHERRQELDVAWGRLREIYEGEGAQAFTEAFEVASARLDEYGERSGEISRRLQSKIEELKRFEAATPPIDTTGAGEA